MEQVLELAEKPERELNPFDKVLVWDEDSEPWHINFFSYCVLSKADKKEKYRCIDTSYYQCIQYEGNEHLLGTSNNPEEENNHG